MTSFFLCMKFHNKFAIFCGETFYLFIYIVLDRDWNLRIFLREDLFFLFWEHLRVVSLVLDLDLELSCPWPWEDLSSESRSLAMASSLVSLTPPLQLDNNFFIILIFFSVTLLLQYILTIVAGVSSWINKI